LHSYHHIIETKVKKGIVQEEGKENSREEMKVISRKKQSVIVIYFESYSCYLYVDSLVQDQFNRRPKNLSGSRQIRYNDSLKEGENGLLLPNAEENNREEEKAKEEKPNVETHTGLYQRIREKISIIWKRIKDFVRNAVNPVILHPPFSEEEEPNFRDTKS
jgi:hypothetical protein